MTLGYDNDVSFWYDRWCSPRPPVEEAYMIFNMAINKQALVADY